MKLAHLKLLEKPEPYWHVQLAVLVAIVLQLSLSNSLSVGPKYVIAGLEALLLLALFVVANRKHKFIYRIRHGMAVILIAIISLANISSLVLVISELFNHKIVSGKELIVSGLAIFLTNIIIFGLWYWSWSSGWRIDQKTSQPQIDFMFPQ
jgi:drug/metabolite transporter (DMT)-like permease